MERAVLSRLCATEFSPVPAACLFGGSTLEENSFAFPPDPGAVRARLRTLLECAIVDYRQVFPELFRSGRRTCCYAADDKCDKQHRSVHELPGVGPELSVAEVQRPE